MNHALTLLYGAACGAAIWWYSKRDREAAARRKELLGDGVENYSPAGQPRSMGLFVVVGILTAARFAYVAWQQHHR